MSNKLASKQATLTGLWRKETTKEPEQAEPKPVEACEPTEPVTKKPKRAKKFQTAWLAQFKWLRVDDQKLMHCLDCEKAVADSAGALVKGSSNYQKSTLTRHEHSDEHLASLTKLKEKRYMDAAVKLVQEKQQPILEAQLRTALYMAKENLADRKFSSLMDLQISTAHLLGGSSSPVKRPKISTNHQAASDFHGYLAAVLKEMMIVRLQKSPFIGIMLDESLDIATKKKLVIFARILHDGTIRNEFCANVEVQDGKAETIYNSLMDFLRSVGVNINKVSGFGTDGASVMTGRRSGVGVKLQENNPRIVHVWCAAHRVALVSYWAAKTVPYLQKVQSILVNIYNFYEFSAPRYNKLRELCAVMGQKVKKFKKPTQVRWLSLQDAVNAIYSGWSALVLGLEHEVADKPQSEGGNKAKGILREIKTFKFISSICLLKDILENMCMLSKSLQKEVIDIDQVCSLIESVKDTLAAYQPPDRDPPSVADLTETLDLSEETEYHGIKISCTIRDKTLFASFKNKFIENILVEFNKRFSAEDMSLLKDLNVVLNPNLMPGDRGNIADYGIEHLDHVCDFYSEIIDTERAKRSFLQFKFLARQHRTKSLLDFCALLATRFENEFPDFCTLATALATIPLTSVPCERGFSVQNRHLDRYSNRRGIQQLENRMLIAHATHQPDFQEDTVVQQAMAKAQRR